MQGLYIHIPFCKSRCIYCNFYSTTYGHDVMEAYVDALCQELTHVTHQPLPLQTIYFGGGTPSQLHPVLLQRLLLYIYKVYDVADDAEVTIECNPDDITSSYMAAITQPSSPINRVSMGVQTFSDQRLQWLHRRHTSQQVQQAVEHLRQAGIKNISIDLMFGFPGETLADWECDILQAISLQPEHISAYSLMIEEGTPLYEMMSRREKRGERRQGSEGSSEDVSDELSREMYETLIDRLTAAGYEHYEISNFARPGFRSRHNSSYWNDTSYLGIGAAAHSYDGCKRWWNVADVKTYIENLRKGISVIEGQETIDTLTHYNDRITTALRTREGISLQSFTETFPEHFYHYLIANAEPHLKRGALAITNGCLHLTRAGLFVSDDIMSDLIQLPS